MQIRVRWWIYAYTLGFAAMAYVQRTTVSVSAPSLEQELGLGKIELGWLFTAFTASYAVAQLPGGALGQRFGPRLVFSVLGALCVLAVVVTACSPDLISGTSLLAVLIAAQLLLGFAQGPVFPVFATVIERWFPARQFGFCNGFSSAAMLLGGALTPPLLVALTLWLGWQQAILATALPAALLTYGWWRYGRDRPDQHVAVLPEELRELDPVPPALPLTWARLLGVLRERNVLLLSSSYLCMGFAFYLLSFWSFLYLVEERKLTGLQSGLLAMIPWLGAALGAGIGGVLTDRLVQVLGTQRGYRRIPLVCLPTSAVMLIATPYAGDLGLAVAALTLAFFLININEASYWAATMRLARTDTGAATGVLNTGGNVGGILCQPIIAALVAGSHWHYAWLSGALAALAAAALWCLVRIKPEPA